MNRLLAHDAALREQLAAAESRAEGNNALLAAEIEEHRAERAAREKAEECAKESAEIMRRARERAEKAERERDELACVAEGIHVGGCAEETRRADAAEAERDRLTDEQAAHVLEACDLWRKEKDDYLREKARADAAEAERDRLVAALREVEKDDGIHIEPATNRYRCDGYSPCDCASRIAAAALKREKGK